MANVLCAVLAMFLLVSVAQSYIVLTANFDDLHDLGKRVVESPVVGHVGSIMRRAYNAFNLNQGQGSKRADDDNDLEYQSDSNAIYRRHNERSDDAQEKQKSKEVETFSSLGKSASVYLQEIKKVLENARD